ncbi:MAG: hypothetical protein A3B68_00575 [Candidatus Melainabacteria bacterium RIFCSPHIGHO2_02_FULL_34_12]|nr:MAG: hypothetical protein A3B68_00575 [Candidatus Melainabacteria bacterium RIFCSPHIGHO2_02_FULL_34_12]
MTGFGNNLSFNIFSAIKNLGKQVKEQLNKVSVEKSTEQSVNNLQQNKPVQSLVNTNSNIPLNASVLNNPAVNQAALNSTNIPQTNLNQEVKNTINTQVPSTPSQAAFKGPSDLPAYAGISNMSLKSWIAEHNNKSFTDLESGEKQLATTLEGIKGFQRQNYEGFDGDSRGKDNQNLKQLARKKYLLILSHIFSAIEQSGIQQTELLVNLANFKKLGSSSEEGSNDDGQTENKIAPPIPEELNNLINLEPSKIKYLHQILALPNEFPECLRLFAKDNIEMNPKLLNNFLMQRLKYVQEQIFGDSNLLSKTIAGFVPLLNYNDYPLVLPLLLLYYPLPLPQIKDNYDFLSEWKKKKGEGADEGIIASCEVYYLSRIRGRFLLKFLLKSNNEFTFDIQTRNENNGIVNDLECAIGEIMFLLEHQPKLADLNVLLTDEIYKATDIDEELAIVSSGPLRLEIILAVYASLLVLNKLNEEPDPAGLIEMS